MRWTILAAALFAAGCPDFGLWNQTGLVPRDPDLEPPRVVSISLGALDAQPRGISRLPVIEVTLSEPLDPTTLDDQAVLLQGSDGEPVPIDLSLDGVALRVEPPDLLAPRTEHRLVLAGTLRDLHGAPLAGADGQAGPFEYTFVTGDESSGPPRVALLSPPEGATDVPRNVAEVVVSFTEPVFGRVRLGPHVGACEGTDRCVIAIPEPLEPVREYSVDASETRDAEGLAARGSPGFMTGRELDAVPPGLGPTACTPSELALGPACASVRDVSLAVRLRTDERAVAFVEIGARRGDGGEAGTEHRVIVTDLTPDTELQITVGATDAAGNVARVEALAVRTLPPLAPIVVTEVYADAAGPEPAQEFVEIANVGPADVDLEGFTIADSGGPGRAIGAGAVLGPGQYGLFVADRFDPASALDPPVAPGAPLFRVGSSLGTNGLLNAGETVMLLDPAGHELSRCPAFLAPRAGVSVQRIAPDADEGAPASWAEDPEVGATGGAANSTGG
jgi:hypothetical protein